MAIISCPSCGNDVSEKAFDCPKCGHPLRKPKRGFFGVLIKWTFILFNILMLVWLVGGTGAAVDTQAGLSGAELAGAQIGTGIGVALILSIWVIGDIILGLLVLFTRPKK
ncbi:zinc ribbon domain-containing protein [Cognatishimia sp. F0-27]|uniref:zinc ribbon domain-containing protein n=1 Tax=Cognatishimia sp. F0-27 TaxID=2816855 RepID=UPI001D0C390B|nr:hypothetical protein [Cognatishimia sp. F0-27]MCC1491556.1 zinc ribbon domain-containing protein [Cognatishimia sp. F0-27]